MAIMFSYTREHHALRGHIDALTVSVVPSPTELHTIANVSVAKRTFTSPREKRISTTSDSSAMRHGKAYLTFDQRQQTTVMYANTTAQQVAHTRDLGQNLVRSCSSALHWVLHCLAYLSDG